MGQGFVRGARVVIRAVVLDVGSVLEVIDDAVFPGPFEQRHGLAPGSVAAASDWPRDAMLGELVYSHEVGLKKPDPAVYELTGSRLDVDVPANVEAARRRMARPSRGAHRRTAMSFPRSLGSLGSSGGKPPDDPRSDPGVGREVRVSRQRRRALSIRLPGISHGAQSQCSSQTK